MKFKVRAGYIALALSYDSKMGSDSAIECVNDNGRVRAFTSLTRAIPQNFGARRNDIVSVLEFKSKDNLDQKIFLSGPKYHHIEDVWLRRWLHLLSC